MDKKALYILCASIFPLMVCSGIVYSVLAIYIFEELAASRMEIGLIYMTGSFTGAIAAPLIGRVSDRVGRRPILLGSMFAFMSIFLLYAVIRDLPQVFPIQALEGATWAAFGAVIAAFIADIVPPENRGWAMGVYERTWCIGWIIGPGLGGFLADTLGFRATFIIGASIMVIGIVLLLLFVKEPYKRGG